MAVNIFDQFGLKEVANVYFEALSDEPEAGIYKGDIVLYLDSLKVSTIETSAESTDATGGWGNAKLITWDYGKDLTVTLEDALLSYESLRFMMGGAIKRPDATTTVLVRHTAEIILGDGGALPQEVVDSSTKTDYTWANVHAYDKYPVRFINLTKGWRTQIYDTTTTFEAGKIIKFKNPAAGVSAEQPGAKDDRVRIFWTEQVATTGAGSDAIEITISPDTFPGTYRVIGDTFMRQKGESKDAAFQFVINEAKVLSNVTITLQAEGDPATFEMQLSVLRATNERGDKEMIKFIRYTPVSNTSGSSGDDDIGSLAAAASGEDGSPTG